MTANPIDVVIVDGALVDKSAFRGYEKRYVRKRMADVNEVRNTNLAGQFSGIDVSSLKALFDIDTGDTTSLDDGVNTLRSLDGFRFKRRSDEGAYIPRDETGIGNVDLSSADTVVLLKPATAAARAVTIPDDLDGPVRVIDAVGAWSDVNVTTFEIEGGGTINGQPDWRGMTAYGEYTFTPIGDGNFLAR